MFTNSEKFVFTPIADIANNIHRLDKLLIKLMILSGILNKLFNIQKIKKRIKNHGIEKDFSFSFFDKNNNNKIKKGRMLTLIILTKVAIMPVCSLTEYPAPITWATSCMVEPIRKPFWFSLAPIESKIIG